MKIALFTETYVPNVNGVVAHVKTLKDGLEKMDHEVLVITADKHARHHYIEDGVLHCPAAEIKRFYGFGAASPISRKRQRLISQFNPDIIHIHHEFGIGLSGIWAARSLKKPLVYTLHTMYDQYIYYIAPRMFLQAATKFSHKYNRFIAKNATILTGPSQKCGEYFKKIGIDKELNLIPNSADLDSFDPYKVTLEQKTKFRQKFDIPENSFLAVFCGRLGKEKSIDVLIEYFSQAALKDHDLHLVIIGDGPDKDALKRMAEKLGMENCITFTGLMKHDQMPICFAACDVYISASLSEMNSISMLEGMASGLPVLQQYDELNADQITTGENGYLFQSAQEMCEILLSLKQKSLDERNDIRKKVIDTMRLRGANQLASYMLSVYEKAIEEKKRTDTD